MSLSITNEERIREILEKYGRDVESEASVDMALESAFNQIYEIVS